MQKKYLLPVFLVFQIVFVKTVSFFPEIVETYYSNSFYLIVSNGLRSIFGALSFSFGDVLYGVLIFLCLKWIFINRKMVLKDWKNSVLKLLRIFSILYFFFHVLWGFNYYRIPIHEKLNIEEAYSKEELEFFTKKMIVKCNELQFKITFNDTVAVKIPYTDEEIFNRAASGFHQLPKDLVAFDYQKESVKISLFSLPLSYMGFGGYLNPFTNEAQVNYLMPKYASPFTTSHEMVHQVGIGSESECNFIGFLAATNNSDDYFKYAAYTVAVRYCLGNLEEMKPGLSEPYIKLLNKGVLKNFNENEVFWAQYQTPINSFFEIFYDNFLKANQQKDGLLSYNKFIGLLIGYQRLQ